VAFRFARRQGSLRGNFTRALLAAREADAPGFERILQARGVDRASRLSTPQPAAIPVMLFNGVSPLSPLREGSHA
jgi:hypothetical protein